MTKRNLFAAVAALCVSLAFFVGCDHSLAEQNGARMTLTVGNPNARAAGSRAAGDAQEFPKVVVKVSGGGAHQERSVSCDLGNPGSGAQIGFDGLPVGTPLTVTAEYWISDQIKTHEGSATETLRPGVVKTVP